MIYTTHGEPVEIIGGPYSRPVGRLDFRATTYRVRSLNDPSWVRERAADELKADAGATEIEAAANAVNER